MKSTSSSQRELKDLEDQVKHKSNRKNEYIRQLEQKKSENDEINFKIQRINNDSEMLRENALKCQNDFFQMKLHSNDLFCKIRQNQESAKMQQDFNERN